MKMLAAPEVWRKVQRAAQRQEKAMRTAVIRLFSSEIPGLEKALASGRASVVEQCVAAAWVGPLDRATRAVRNSLLTCLVDGGEAQAALTTPAMRAAERSSRKINIGFAFDQTSPEAIAWAQKHAGSLVTNLSAQQRKNVRQLVTNSFVTQQTTKQLAAQLKDVVGLTGPQFSKYQRLLAEDQRAAQVYAKKAWQARAVTIARTETLRASNEGQRQAWEQATKQGLLSGRELREWITTYDDRTCPICAPMDGQLADLKGSFKLPDGSGVSGPPAHVKCRCAQSLSAKTRKPGATNAPVAPTPVVEVETGTVAGAVRLRGDLTTDQLNQIREYQNGAGVNIPLRSGTPLTDLLAKQVTEFDAVMAQTVTAADTVVYRAYNPVFLELTEGMEFVDKGFVSTSLTDAPWLKGFGSQILEIQVPKGIGAIDMNAILQERSIYGWQEELLLNRNLRFKVEKVLSDRVLVRVLGAN